MDEFKWQKLTQCKIYNVLKKGRKVEEEARTAYNNDKRLVWVLLRCTVGDLLRWWTDADHGHAWKAWKAGMESKGSHVNMKRLSSWFTVLALFL